MDVFQNRKYFGEKTKDMLDKPLRSVIPKAFPGCLILLDKGDSTVSGRKKTQKFERILTCNQDSWS